MTAPLLHNPRRLPLQDDKHKLSNTTSSDRTRPPLSHGPVPAASAALSRGAAAAPAARVRTADEIRQAYGRAPRQKAAGEVRTVLEDGRRALVERGERLSQLQAQTADLADSAAGFAQLARQLADKERGRSGWLG